MIILEIIVFYTVFRKCANIYGCRKNLVYFRVVFSLPGNAGT